jgi:GNAT superfamily N-acetyltransferase
MRHAAVIATVHCGMNDFRITAAQPGDIPAVLAMIRGLAEFERLAHLCIATEDQLSAALFAPDSTVEVVVAWEGDENAGFALFFHNFSTFLGQRGLYLEDLFIRPQFRGRGYGRALLVYLARLAVERGCGRFEWAVLDWNEKAIGFYRALGATVLPDWRITRVAGEALSTLAAAPTLPRERHG